MKHIIPLFLIVIMAIFITTTTVYADNEEDNAVIAPFTSGYLSDGEHIYLKLKYGFDFLNQGSETLNWELALTGAVLSNEVYDFTSDPKSDQKEPEIYKFSKDSESESAQSTVQPILIALGYTDTCYYYYENSVLHPSACFGYNKFKDQDGKVKNVFLIVVRGTQGGADKWTDFLNGGFRTFEEATFNVRDDFMKFVGDVIGKDVDLKNEDNIFFITGHSLGGAIANRLSITDTIVDLAGHDNNKIYTYTFEAPHTCFNYWWMNPQGMSNAFNFKDVDDFVANVPVGVGATRYGTDLEFSVGYNPYTMSPFERALLGEGAWKESIDELNQLFLRRTIENLDNQIFMSLFPKAKGGSVTEAPKCHYFGWKNFFGGHHDMGLPLTYILQKGIEEKTWESIEDVLQISSNEIENESSETDDKMVFVKQIRYDVYGTELLCIEYEYNVTGKMVREKDYDFAGVSDGSRDIGYEYDDKGNLIKKIYYNAYNADGSINYDAYNSDKNIMGWEEFEYDSDGNEIKATSCAYDGSIFDWMEYGYDNVGNMTKEVWYNENGDIIDWDEYEYDDVGNKIKEISYNEDGSISDWQELEYDSAGNKIKIISYNEDGSISWWQESEYDNVGNKIKVISYNEDGSVRYWEEYKYDAVGNQTKWISYRNGNVDYKIESEYDNAGNKIKDISYHYNIYGDMSGWSEDEYDSNGNKIKQTNFNEDGSIDYWEEYQYESFSVIRNKAINIEN